MALAPGSHLLGPLPHAETSADENMLAFGQTIEEGRRGDVVGGVGGGGVVGALMAGEASLHYFRTVHWSGPNANNVRRVGLAIRYARADMGRVERAAAAPATRETATLVSSTYDPATVSIDLEPIPSGRTRSLWRDSGPITSALCRGGEGWVQMRAPIDCDGPSLPWDQTMPRGIVQIWIR